MAKQQYVIGGELDWQSNSGAALIAISNIVGSNKKLTLRSFTITPLTSTTTPTAGTVSAAPPTMLSLARATVSGADTVTPTRLDSNASAWPSTVAVLKSASVASPSPIARIAVAKQTNQASLSWLAMQRPIGNMSRVSTRPFRGNGTLVEGYVVRAGEGLALYADNLQNAIPLRVSATITRVGAPNRTYHVTYFINAQAADVAVFAINNTAGSGETVVLRELAVEECGTFDSPYFQLVPVGAIEATDTADTSKMLTAQPMDTAYPSADAFMRVLQNVVIFPFGQPENAFSSASTGSPQGFNYLKTKDFLGPVYRTLFPEFVTQRSGNVPDGMGLGRGHKNTDLFVRRSGIVIREGEAVALVSGAETAAGATTAVGLSGWSSWHISATIDIEPKLAPVLTLTGLQNPTEVRIFQAGTGTELAGQEDVTTGSFSWTFDPDVSPSVDISILSLGFQNLRLKALALTLADVTIPIQQQVDRQFQNPP